LHRDVLSQYVPKNFYIKILPTLKSDAWFIADYQVKKVSKGRLLNDLEV